MFTDTMGLNTGWFHRPPCSLCGASITNSQSWHGDSNGYYHYRCELDARRRAREGERVRLLAFSFVQDEDMPVVNSVPVTAESRPQEAIRTRARVKKAKAPTVSKSKSVRPRKKMAKSQEDAPKPVEIEYDFPPIDNY